LVVIAGEFNGDVDGVNSIPDRLPYFVEEHASVMLHLPQFLLQLVKGRLSDQGPGPEKCQAHQQEYAQPQQAAKSVPSESHGPSPLPRKWFVMSPSIDTAADRLEM
jgi:hypothetical protein